MSYKFWFMVGSQHLYGAEVLKEVAEHGNIMAKGLNSDEIIPFEVVFKGVATTPEEIKKVCVEANGDSECAGVISWMHTFSPSKMWIGGLSILNKPYLHLNTQFNRNIPFDTIDMNFMNTNQSAHGDREHGFITARLRMKRKVICGYWEDKAFRRRIGGWMRSAAGALFSRSLKVMRLGDNMRYVAVTEGDKIQAEKDFGWSVNTYGVGGFAELVNNASDAETNEKIEEYRSRYAFNTNNIEAVRYQAKLETALEQMLTEGGFDAYTDTFEDLYGLMQLPGLATQNLMSKGYGFGAEGDWKTAALAAVMRAMSQGLDNGLSFIEDYTYHFELGNEAVLGAHMLEISPAIAADRPRIEVHPLGIGGKADPARLVFEGKKGDALLTTIVDMGGRFRLISHDIHAIAPLKKMPNLPVASVMWRPEPDMITGNEAWILCGGTHHSVISYDLTAEHMRDFAEIMGIEFIHINKNTTIPELRDKLALSDIIWRG
ncbi:MAG: L-arabinose isomerase [Firmicutes bacterium ADurb.Bin182]|nr:MAG: L-arabinose isomerase [Firmicutes bacterium ADurb.Bin182]